jgi:serine/threonine protein kinase/formylglycine-generating enzyme required for sulfatase activity/dienelactone hydrolase
MDEDSIFVEALKRPTRDRGAYLDQACGDNPELRKSVESLLRAHEKAGDFMQGKAADQLATLDQPAMIERPGSQIGPYKLLQEIGEGGMGVVYMAEQFQPVKRRVALKIVKPGMDTRHIVARFEAERQALAMMDHPNVARVLDAGATTAGRPYFVMELVKGIPITRYCDENHLAIGQRLKLFAAVCHAVQHAHHKGIIHRDLKPSNVLVAEYDDQAVPKVIDFGVAKALNQSLTDKTMFTQFGQIVGTIEYMSPEQAKFNQLDVDTRSDIYSLGVLLYELLTGATPFDKERLRSTSFDELIRIINEEEPPRPSTRLSASGTLPALAANRNTEAKKLAGLVRGELDWIVMRALEKDRTRRYETAGALAADVERYLNDEPVQACPPSLGYRLRKFARRNKSRLTMAGSIAAAVVIAAFAINLAVRNSRREAELAQQVQQKEGEVQRKAGEVQQRDEEAQRRKWAREIAIPQILAWKDAEQLVSAFKLAREVKEVLPEDPVFLGLWEELTGTAPVDSNPPGARVSIRDWNAVDGQWLEVGVTPLEDALIPAGPVRWRFEKEGFATREAQLESLHDKVTNNLQAESDFPEMVLIPRWKLDGEEGERTLRAFMIDTCEVSNRDYQKFVDAGGYEIQDYWKEKFINESGEPIAWEAAMETFIDETGWHGPKTWRDGRFPEGKDDYPVTGVSWYEAKAYARFAKKGMPTLHHWSWASYGDDRFIRPLSNLHGSGPEPVGSNQGISIFGVYDLGGNVKEWCLNEYGEHERILRGGDWKSPSYMLRATDHAPPMAREENYGFRCSRQFYEGNEWAFEPRTSEPIIFRPPATDEEIEQYLRLYAYDKDADLNAALVTTDGDQSDAELRHEIVQIDAAYGKERFDIHLLIPRQGRPPFQTILWVPGVGALQRQSQEERRQSMEFDYERALAKTGRIVCSPVCQGMYERRVEGLNLAVRRRDWRIQVAKDLSRTLDYLETRPDDVDSKSLVYCGLSMGATFAPCHLVAEPRFKSAILIAAGAKDAKISEIDPMTYAAHVKIPLLVMNGQFDTVFVYDEHQLPFFERLGSQDKHLEIFSTAFHLPPVDDSVRFADQWLRDHTQPTPIGDR